LADTWADRFDTEQKHMNNVAALAQESKHELASQLARARAALSNMRETTKHAARLGTNAVMTAVGGAAAGVLAVKLPTILGGKVPTDFAIGTVLVGLAAADMFDGYDEQLNSLGAGLLAAAAARETQSHLLAKQQAAA
jgi:hypothetical protein